MRIGDGWVWWRLAWRYSSVSRGRSHCKHVAWRPHSRTLACSSRCRLVHEEHQTAFYGTAANTLWAVTLAPFVYIRACSLDATSPSCVLTEVCMRTGWRIAKLYKWSLKIHWQLVWSDAIRDVRVRQVLRLLEELVWRRWASSILSIRCRFTTYCLKRRCH